MDEAMVEALRNIREEQTNLRADFKAHVLEDREAIMNVTKQIVEWTGQLQIIKYLCGAILSAMIAYGIKHW